VPKRVLFFKRLKTAQKVDPFIDSRSEQIPPFRRLQMRKYGVSRPRRLSLPCRIATRRLRLLPRLVAPGVVPSAPSLKRTPSGIYCPPFLSPSPALAPLGLCNSTRSLRCDEFPLRSLLTLPGGCPSKCPHASVTPGGSRSPSVQFAAPASQADVHCSNALHRPGEPPSPGGSSLLPPFTPPTACAFGIDSPAPQP